MKLPPLLLSLASLVAAYALTTLWLNQQGEAPPASGAGTVSVSPPRPGLRSLPTGAVLSEVLRLLRSGDVDGARDALSPLAGSDPAGFFALLRKLPYFSGLDDLINQAAAGLAWNDPEAIYLLNQVGSLDWRNQAWLAYVRANVGKAADQQVLEVISRACFPEGDAALLEPLFRDAADKRPLEFATLFTQRGRANDLEPFFVALLKSHPEHFQEIWSIVSPKITSFYHGTFARQLIMHSPTAATLTQLTHALGDAAYGDMSSELASNAYHAAPPEERAGILAVVASQPPATRNAMLSGILASASNPPFAEDLGQMLGDMTSYPVQLASLRRWMQSQPGLDPADRTWIDQLPTQKLKAAANALLDLPR